MKKLEIVKAEEDAIFISLDDALFLEELSISELETYEAMTPQTGIDGMVKGALKRVINVSLPNDQGWYNGSKGRK